MGIGVGVWWALTRTLSVCPSVCLSLCLSVCLSFPVWKLKGIALQICLNPLSLANFTSLSLHSFVIHLRLRPSLILSLHPSLCRIFGNYPVSKKPTLIVFPLISPVLLQTQAVHRTCPAVQGSCSGYDRGRGEWCTSSESCWYRHSSRFRCVAYTTTSSSLFLSQYLPLSLSLPISIYSSLYLFLNAMSVSLLYCCLACFLILFDINLFNFYVSCY